MNRILKKMMSSGALALTLGLSPLAVVAASPSMPGERVFKGHTELPDATLGLERGAYINANQILYFGVEMVSSLYNSSDQLVASSQVNIGIDRGNGTPIVNIKTGVSTPDANSIPLTSNSSPSGNLDNNQGVGQLIQVTGNGNHITNNADVCIGSPTQCQVSSSPTPNGQPYNPTTNASADANVTGNQASVSVSVNGQNTASQSINMSGLHQNAQVSGDALHIQNQLNMVIQIQPSTTLSASQISEVLHTLPNM